MLQFIQYDDYQVYIVISGYIILYDIDCLIRIININIKSLIFIIHELVGWYMNNLKKLRLCMTTVCMSGKIVRWNYSV